LLVRSQGAAVPRHYNSVGRRGTFSVGDAVRLALGDVGFPNSLDGEDGVVHDVFGHQYSSLFEIFEYDGNEGGVAPG
jgi:hypothetical protein